jgi:release factor glutamine methyltransferase
MEWTVFKLLSWTESYFVGHEVDSPRLTAEILLGHCLGIERLDLYLQHDRPLEKPELARFKTLIQRRKNREPVAYITGKKGFFESCFQVGPGVLIPRPDTETLVEKTLGVLAQDVQNPGRILELGVGSGAIVISLAKAYPEHQFFAGDISLAALNTARKNAAREKEIGTIHFFNGYWFDSLSSRPFFDIIVSNPPYIPRSHITDLAPEIREYEPISALDGGDDGLDCIREILSRAGEFLVPGGHLLMEMGFDQKTGLTALVKNCPEFDDPDFTRDLAGHDRVVHVKKKID